MERGEEDSEEVTARDTARAGPVSIQAPTVGTGGPVQWGAPASEDAPLCGWGKLGYPSALSICHKGLLALITLASPEASRGRPMPAPGARKNASQPEGWV